MDDGNGRAPVALAAYAPIAQAPGGFFLAQPFGGKLCGYMVYGLLVGHAIKLARVGAHGALLVGIPFLPRLGGESLPFCCDNLLDGQVVFAGKGKVALIMRWHAHHCAIAIAHEHIVAHPQWHVCACNGVGYAQARGHAFFFFQCQFCFGGATFFAFFDEGSQWRVALRCTGGQRVLGRYGAEGYAHDGVGTGGKDVHFAVANQLPACICNAVRKGKAYAFAFANPVLLHQAHALGPAVQGGFRVAHLHMVEQLLRVVGNFEVVAWDFAFFYHCACAPAFAIDDLFVGKHGLVYGVPIDDLRFAVGNAFFQHFQEKPLVPFVVAGITGGKFAAPVYG